MMGKSNGTGSLHQAPGTRAMSEPLKVGLAAPVLRPALLPVLLDKGFGGRDRGARLSLTDLRGDCGMHSELHSIKESRHVSSATGP